jgi:hypothetical protein
MMRLARVDPMPIVYRHVAEETSHTRVRQGVAVPTVVSSAAPAGEQ